MEERKDRKELIRTIYLYLFALIGLVLLVIGSVGFVNMGLKTWVFTKSDQDRYLYEGISEPYPIARLEKASEGNELSVDDKEAVKKIIEDYNERKERNAKIDGVQAGRHRDAATNLALIIVGLPLYLYHWMVIRRDKGVVGMKGFSGA